MRRWLKRIAVAVAALGLLGVGGLFVALEIAASLGEFPAELLAARPGTTEIRDRHGEVLRETLSPEQDRSRWVPLKEVSPHLLRALLAAEDSAFLEHRGVDHRGILRALWQNLTGRRAGGSTLTQQVVKLVYPRRRSVSAKWREAVLALRLERVLDKGAILEQYVNRAPFGAQLAGVEAASRGYFGKPASQLSLAEAALLAGLPKAPAANDPRRHPQRALARRAWVLARMRVLGLISPKEFEWAAREPLTLVAAAPPFEAPHFTAEVLRTAPRRAGAIATTLDGRLQRRAEVLLRRTIDALRGRGGTQAAALVVENRSGEVLAYVGSYDWRDPVEGRNDGVRALRQPGSALKPFAYALAFEGDLTPASVLGDVPAYFTTPLGEYSPRNYDGGFHGPVLAREALANSYNVAAVQVAHRLLPGALLERLRRSGFGSLARDQDHYGLGLVLGNGEVTLWELAAAYLALARGGERVEPIFARGAARPEPVRVFSPEASYLVTHVLSDAHARKAAFGERSALELPFPAAVKTGTSTDFRDNWTVGYTPEVTVAVWVGNFSGKPMRGVSGVSGAAPLWNELIQAAMEGRPERGFPRPASLETVHICPRSGKLAGPHCDGRRQELFRAGTAPAETCDLHVQVRVDRRNGLLWGPACASSLSERREGERYAPEFARWAARVGRPLAPRRPSPACGGRAEQGRVRIVAPRDGEVLAMTPDLPRGAQRLALEAEVEGAPAAVRWLVDGREVARAQFPYTGRWQIQPGTHELVAVAGSARSRPVRLTVRE
jgi:penicillin-binding protein 1C